MSVDVIDGLNIDSPLPRIGAEFVWQKRAFLRGGYVFDSAESEAGGPTLGLGFTRNNLVLDLARVFTGFSADAGAGADISLASSRVLGMSRLLAWSLVLATVASPVHAQRRDAVGFARAASGCSAAVRRARRPTAASR